MTEHTYVPFEAACSMIRDMLHIDKEVQLTFEFVSTYSISVERKDGQEIAAKLNLEGKSVYTGEFEVTKLRKHTVTMPFPIARPGIKTTHPMFAPQGRYSIAKDDSNE